MNISAKQRLKRWDGLTFCYCFQEFPYVQSRGAALFIAGILALHITALFKITESIIVLFIIYNWFQFCLKKLGIQTKLLENWNKVLSFMNKIKLTIDVISLLYFQPHGNRVNWSDSSYISKQTAEHFASLCAVTNSLCNYIFLGMLEEMFLNSSK